VEELYAPGATRRSDSAHSCQARRLGLTAIMKPIRVAMIAASTTHCDQLSIS
jgi:hypothetical protein